MTTTSQGVVHRPDSAPDEGCLEWEPRRGQPRRGPEQQRRRASGLLVYVVIHPVFPLTAGLWILIAIGAQVGFLAGGIWGAVVTAALSLTVGSGALGWTLARRFPEVSTHLGFGQASRVRLPGLRGMQPAPSRTGRARLRHGT